MLISIALYLAVAYIALALIAVFISNSIIFPAPPSSYKLGEMRTAAIPSPGKGKIALLDARSGKKRFHIIYCHGNGADLGRIAPLIKKMADELECDVTAFDYPGYGASDGKPSETSVLKAAETVFEHLRQQGIKENKIVIWGRSVGGGPAVHLATIHNVQALILESAFKSAFSVPFGLNPLPFDKFDNISAIDKINCPLLVIHGREDSIIPFKHGEALYAKAKQPKQRLWFDDAGHNDIEYLHGEAIWKAVKDFIVDKKNMK